MTPLQVAVASDELVAAYKRWDQSCAALSKAAQDAIDRGERPPPPPRLALVAETRRLAAAERALGAPLGWTDRVAALRRSGRGAEDAVQVVVTDLTAEIAIR